MATAISEAFEKAKRDEISKAELTVTLLENDVVVPANTKLVLGKEYLEPIRMEIAGIIHMAVFDSTDSFEKSDVGADTALITPAGGLLYTVPDDYGIAVNTTEGFFSIDPVALAGLRKLNPKN